MILRTNEVSIDSSSVTFTRVAVAIVSKSGGGVDWRCWVCRSEKARFTLAAVVCRKVVPASVRGHGTGGWIARLLIARCRCMP